MIALGGSSLQAIMPTTSQYQHYLTNFLRVFMQVRNAQRLVAQIPDFLFCTATLEHVIVQHWFNYIIHEPIIWERTSSPLIMPVGEYLSNLENILSSDSGIVRMIHSKAYICTLISAKSGRCLTLIRHLIYIRTEYAQKIQC